jgi:hypothetical protein
MTRAVVLLMVLATPAVAQVDCDGCSELCRVETGFACAGAPSVCTPLSAN